MIATAEQRQAWSRVPVDEVGYLSSAGLAAMDDDRLRAMIAEMAEARYGGWRNYGGLWLSAMELHRAEGLRVLDFGCGTGIEALTYARAGASVSLADIVPENVALAARVLRVHGFEPAGELVIADRIEVAAHQFDVVHMSGVLHHIPDPVPVMAALATWLPSRGEVRLMVYSDRGWRIAVGGEPPEQVAGHPDHYRFVRFFDGVGDYADWYDEARLGARFGEWFTVGDVTYITPDDRYLTATLRRR